MLPRYATTMPARVGGRALKKAEEGGLKQSGRAAEDSNRIKTRRNRKPQALESCSLLQAKRGPVIQRGGNSQLDRPNRPAPFLLGVAQKSRLEDAGWTTKRVHPLRMRGACTKYAPFSVLSNRSNTRPLFSAVARLPWAPRSIRRMQSHGRLACQEIVRHSGLRLILKGSQIAPAELVCPDVMLCWDVGGDHRPFMLVSPGQLTAQRVAGAMRR